MRPVIIYRKQPVLLSGFLASAVLLNGLGGSSPAQGREAASEDIARMSLEDLANVEVTSVSKSNEALQGASAAIYVISHEDIMRSGLTSIPDVLRLAPNLLVTQVSASQYTIAARGLGGNQPAQNFPNKLLILIDGRSVYSPLFSGIYANTIDVMLEDVERIEVIGGVGATLWGANAMNGVVNIITRPSYLTQGTFVDAGAGNQTQSLGARYGGRVDADTTFRVYGFEFHRGAEELADGSTAHDGWSKGQGGFRSEWSAERDTVTVQGDIYRGTENQLANSDGLVLGANMLTRYQHHGTAADLQVQAYYDQTEQFGPGPEGLGFVVHTYDVELQQTLAAGQYNRIIWGAGERVNSYGIANSPTLLFDPSHHALTLANAFIQDTAALTQVLNLTVGIKLEDDPWSGWSPLPDARLTLRVDDRTTVWTAASRAIRAPTPFDDEVVEKIGTTAYLAANTGFRPERVTAYEFGVRAQPQIGISLSVAPFYNVYDDLRTIEPAATTSGLPYYWGNSMRGDTYGVDAWADWQVNHWWRLSPGFSWVRERLAFKAGASEILGLAQAADDPSSHATLTSSMNFPHHLTFDATVRYVGALPSPSLPHYDDLDARLGWQASGAVELSLSGANLLHARHTEFPGDEQITRTVFAEARCRF